ncbi:MAG: DUF2807 domain-containing protein [Bacteroidales bacterium]|nr:DUF2807 domain-containing protein [Bacteroidales bacterium]
MKRAVLIISILLSINVLTAQSLNYYNLEPFTVVDINFVGEVVIKQCATSNEVNIKANDYKFIKNTHVVVSDGKLFIYMDNNTSREKKDNIQMEIHLPRLEKLTLLGASDVMVEKRNEPNLTVINAGVGECTLQCLKIEGSLELHNKSAGGIKVSSPDPIRQQILLINNSGTGNVSILGCHVSNSLIVNNMGVGDISVNLMSIPTEELILRNKSVGDIRIQNVLAQRLELRNLGVGNLKMMNGKAEEMTLESVGVGNVSLLLKVATAHITHGGVGNITATVTGTAYLTEKSELGKVTIHGGGKVVEEKP